MHLFEVYVAINKDVAEEDESLGSSPPCFDCVNECVREIFKNMEAGDEETLALWRRSREMSIRTYQKVYARPNLRFDVYSGESR